MKTNSLFAKQKMTVGILCVVCALIVITTSCDNQETQQDELYISVRAKNASEYSNIAEVKLMVYDGNYDV